MQKYRLLLLSSCVVALSLAPSPAPQAATKPMAPVVVAGLDLTDSFSTVVGKLPLSDDWVFGTAAVPPRVGKAVTNASQLAVDFDPLQPWTGTVTINSELQRYAKAFTAANFVFGADYLQLKAIKATGSFNAVVGTTKASGTALNLDGTAITLDQLGITTTTGLEVGQLVVIGGRYSAQWVKRGDQWLIRSEVFVALTCSGVGCDSAAVP